MRGLFSWPSLISMSIAISFATGFGMQTYSNHFAKSRIETGNTVVLDGGTIILSNVAFAAATRENLGISDDPQMRLLAPSFDEPPIVSGDVCRPSVTSSVGEGAVIDLEITASCDVGSEFVVHHNGMMFSDVIDSTGFAHVTVPALTEKAIIIVDFPNASQKLVIEQVADASRFTRSVLQWKGDFDLSLDTNPPAQATQVFQLGRTGGYNAVVQSFANDTGIPNLVISSVPNGPECHHMIEFQYMQFDADRSVKIRDYHNTPVVCSDGTKNLVLKNLYQTAKVARN